jgi:hypothetical protein
MEEGRFLLETLQSDWAIILAIFILAILQGYKIWIDKNNERENRIMNHRLENTMSNIEGYLRLLADQYAEEVTDIQMPIIIDVFVGHIKEAILCEGAASITRNDVKNNRAEINAKLDAFICNRFKELATNLGRFKWKGRYLSEFLDMQHKHKVIKNVNDVVLKERDTDGQKLIAYRNLDSVIRQRFDEIQNEIKFKAYGESIIN